jgi:hypothetical protein
MSAGVYGGVNNTAANRGLHMTPRSCSNLLDLRRLAAPAFVALLVAGCVSATTAGPTTAPATPSGSAVPAGSSAAGGSVNGFYLRAWQTQALAPQYTFGSVPTATVSDGQFIDGMVAIPMIYPGPLYVGLSARPVSAPGIQAIVAEARADGLMGETTDFSKGLMPGAVSAHIQLVVDGVSHELTGSLPTGTPAASVTPGTPEAFEAFWSKLQTLNTWLAADLGPSASYSPTSIAVLLTPPTAGPTDIKPQVVAWPLAGTFAKFGTPMGNDSDRCGIVTGSDLAKLLPAVRAGNALTRFTDSTGATDAIAVRVLVPGETGPCA